jgi:phthiodiolone/phenolphthiodiolone dimycocerosates ketoreductase
VRDVKYGALGIHFPPVEAHFEAARMYEASGVDFMVWADQMSLTIPRTIWTRDLVPSADVWDIDCYMDPFVMITAASSVTESMALGITAVDATRRTPASIAQQALSVDHYCRGRFFLAMGAGEQKQFAPYGLARNKPFAHLEESMKIIRMLWEADGPVSYDGPIWKLERATMVLEPYRGKSPLLLVAGGPGRAIEIAGRYADGWVTYIPTCGDPDWYAEQVRTVKQEAEKNGRDPEKLIFYIAAMSIIDETEERIEEWISHPVLRWDAQAVVPHAATYEAWGEGPHPQGTGYSYPSMLIPQNWTREDALRIAEQVTPGAVRRARATGTPNQVANEIQGYIEAGANWLNLVNYTTLLGSGDFGDALKHQSLLADTIGHLRRMNGQEVAVAAAVSR